MANRPWHSGGRGCETIPPRLACVPGSVSRSSSARATTERRQSDTYIQLGFSICYFKQPPVHNLGFIAAAHCHWEGLIHLVPSCVVQNSNHTSLAQTSRATMSAHAFRNEVRCHSTQAMLKDIVVIGPQSASVLI